MQKTPQKSLLNVPGNSPDSNRDELPPAAWIKTVTSQRKLAVNFSEPYLTFRLCAVTNKDDNIDSLDHCKGKNAGVRIATEAEAFIKNNLPENKLTFSDTNEELYQLLRKRKLDLVIDDSPIAGAFIKENKNLKLFLLKDTESAYAIAFNKSNLQDKLTIDQLLREIKLDGAWQRLYDKWFKDSKM